MKHQFITQLKTKSVLWLVVFFRLRKQLKDILILIIYDKYRSGLWAGLFLQKNVDEDKVIICDES